MQASIVVASALLASVMTSGAEISPASPDIYRPATVAQSWSCQPRRTCGQIGSCEEAKWYLYNCSWGGKLDGDSDGAPCEKLCGSNN
jgi:hypothetical protein